ncbi:hypothetical protein SAMN04487897_11375 [Paenibacillus sp. yr247]|uniref:hypothetical protein n=1 Tax=Paenibacillus sp. yr247 TaxID=1761880 RepID=UPI00088C733D|nr:hypothetical protein [Paenibacillus sp. yr247]SDO39620.1 hypothetical protein SAMN04487897_11375 [Paenibacillus sp. yr247]
MEIGINLFSVNQALNEDYFKTLERVAECGYRNVELIATNKYGARFGDSIPLPALKKKLAELGLNPIAAHEGIMPGVNLNEIDWDFIIRNAPELVCPLPVAFNEGIFHIAQLFDFLVYVLKIETSCPKIYKQIRPSILHIAVDLDGGSI